MRKPTISVDFDGVLHSYKSGWKGARNIPDDPVPGAIEWLCSMLMRYQIAISSARSSQFGGRRAMKQWVREHAARLFLRLEGDEWLALIDSTGYCSHGTEPDESDSFGRHVVALIQWPRVKPSAQLYIDDRAWLFTGTFPSHDEIRSFKPWNK